MKILSIDDDAFERQTMLKELESRGFEVTSCSSGEEGVACAKKTKFDAIVSDLIMPGLSGEDLINELTAIPGYNEIPILIVTSSGKGSQFYKATNRKHFVLVKPVNHESLVRLIKLQVSEAS